MRKLTSEEFQKTVELNPAWARDLTEPVEITGYCDMRGSNITHLSPLLHFTGLDPDNQCATFRGCANLKTASGNFAGYVNFGDAGISKIKELAITGTSTKGAAASFFHCLHLEKATGTYPGSVNFGSSGVKKIQELHITGTSHLGRAASFESCTRLAIAEGTFPGQVNFNGSGIHAIKDLHIAEADTNGDKATFEACANLKTIPISILNDPTCQIPEKTRKIARKEHVRKTIAGQPSLEI